MESRIATIVWGWGRSEGFEGFDLRIQSGFGPRNRGSHPSFDFAQCKGRAGSEFEMKLNLEWNLKKTNISFLCTDGMVDSGRQYFVADTAISPRGAKSKKDFHLLLPIFQVRMWLEILKWKRQWSNGVEIKFDNLEKWPLSVFLGEVDVIAWQGNIEPLLSPNWRGRNKITHRMISYDIVWHHMTLYDIVWHCTTSYYIIWHHMTSYDIWHCKTL